MKWPRRDWLRRHHAKARGAPGEPGAPQHWHVQYAAYKTQLLDAPVIDTTMNAVDLLED